MSEWKRMFGVDFFDTMVHLMVTVALMALIGKESRQVEPVVLTGVGSLLLYAARRTFALRRARNSGALSDETTTGVHRKIDTEARLEELEALYGRVAELEERVDFAERLLSKQGETPRLDAPRT